MTFPPPSPVASMYLIRYTQGVAKRVIARFYVTAGGTEPVRDWLLSLSRDDRRTVGVDIATVEFWWPIGMPTCRPMGGGLYEVRSDISSGRIARVLFAFDGHEVVLLHGFIKKSQQTPIKELTLAKTRARDI